MHKHIMTYTTVVVAAVLGLNIIYTIITYISILIGLFSGTLCFARRIRQSKYDRAFVISSHCL